MKRYVAALLVVLGLVGVVGVLAVGTGFAKDEKAAVFLGEAKCSEATLHGRYLFAQNGVDIFGKDQVPFAMQGMNSLMATVRRRLSLQVTSMGMFFATGYSPARIASRRIAQAPPPILTRRRTGLCEAICSSPPMEVCSRSSLPNPPSR